MSDLIRAFLVLLIAPLSIPSWIIPILLVVSIFFPQERAKHGSMAKKWQAKAACCLMRYFSYRIVLFENAAFDAITPSILSTSPHGVFPMGSVLTYWALEGLGHVKITPTAASSLLRSPLVRHWALNVGTIPANYDRLIYELKTGHNIAIVLGGIAEIFEFDHPVAIISERTGFVRLAIESKARLIPSYIFGDRNLLACVKDPYGFLQWLSRKIRFPCTFFWGRHGLPIPRRRAITAVIGNPIDTSNLLEEDRGEATEQQSVTAEDPPSSSQQEHRHHQIKKTRLDAQVVKVHHEYLLRINEIFETFKTICPGETANQLLKVKSSAL